MQRGIEGTVLHLQKFICSSLNMLADLMTVSRAMEEGPQYEHVQGSLKKSDPRLCLFLHRRHSTLNLTMMVDIRLSIVKMWQEVESRMTTLGRGPQRLETPIGD